MPVWAVVTNHGPGSLTRHSPATISGVLMGWDVLYGIQIILGLWSGGIVGQSDWTRYSKTRNADLSGQEITAPITIIVTALCDLIITSASAAIHGKYFWKPLELLLHIQLVSIISPRSASWYAFSGACFSLVPPRSVYYPQWNSSGMDMAT